MSNNTHDNSLHHSYQDSLVSHYIVRLKECILGNLHIGIPQDMRMAEELDERQYDKL